MMNERERNCKRCGGTGYGRDEDYMEEELQIAVYTNSMPLPCVDCYGHGYEPCVYDYP